MKINIILIITLMPFLTFSQKIEDLDKRNGFKHFKLDSSLSEYKDIIKDDSQATGNPNIIDYIYIGNDIKTILDVEIRKVELSFFKNKLCRIQLYFGDIIDNINFTLTNYHSILYSLEQLYGTDTFNAVDDSGIIINGTIWDGKNVKLELIRTDYSKNKGISSPLKNIKTITGYIHIYDKNLMKLMYQSEF